MSVSTGLTPTSSSRTHSTVIACSCDPRCESELTAAPARPRGIVDWCRTEGLEAAVYEAVVSDASWAMHSKVLIADDREALITSANFPTWARLHNTELGVWVGGRTGEGGAGLLPGVHPQ